MVDVSCHFAEDVYGTYLIIRVPVKQEIFDDNEALNSIVRQIVPQVFEQLTKDGRVYVPKTDTIEVYRSKRRMRIKVRYTEVEVQFRECVDGEVPHCEVSNSGILSEEERAMLTAAGDMTIENS